MSGSHLLYEESAAHSGKINGRCFPVSTYISLMICSSESVIIKLMYNDYTEF